MLDAHAAGGLSTDELLATYGFLFFAGYETTTTLISNGVLALLRHPDQMRCLRDDPALITTTVEEFLRYASPTQILWRTVLADVDMLGCAFRKNQRVELLTGAANRDPERFAEPDQLKVDRSPTRTLASARGYIIAWGPTWRGWR